MTVLESFRIVTLANHFLVSWSEYHKVANASAEWQQWKTTLVDPHNNVRYVSNTRCIFTLENKLFLVYLPEAKLPIKLFHDRSLCKQWVTIFGADLCTLWVHLYVVEMAEQPDSSLKIANTFIFKVSYLKLFLLLCHTLSKITLLWRPRVHDRLINSSLFSAKGHHKKDTGCPAVLSQALRDRRKKKKKKGEDFICILPRSRQSHPEKQFTLTVVLLAQQVFCGRKEHFHKFWNLPDDMNCTQRCLSTQKTISEGKEVFPFWSLTKDVQHTSAERRHLRY